MGFDRRGYDNARWKRIKQEMVELLGNRCVDCGAAEALEFDHREPKLKSFSITSNLFRPRALLVSEVFKCDLRCGPCHRRRTAKQHAVPHGGGRTGKKHCKCPLCKAKKQEYMYYWKRNRKRL